MSTPYDDFKVEKQGAAGRLTKQDRVANRDNNHALLLDTLEDICLSFFPFLPSIVPICPSMLLRGFCFLKRNRHTVSGKMEH